MTERRVVATYLAVAGLYTLSASLIWGVNTLFLLDAGLSIGQMFVANAAFTAGMMVFEIPTGVVADTSGRRRSFLLSLAVLAVGTLLYLWLWRVGAGVVAFSAASVLLGLGYTFYSGAVEAWLVDALHAVGSSTPLDVIFARGGYVTGGAMLVGTVGGGALGQLSLALPYIVRAVLLIIVFVLAWRFMHDVGFTSRPVPARDYLAEMRRVAAAGVTYGWRVRSLRTLMATSFIQTGIFTWMFYAWPPHLLELLGRDAVWVAGVMSGAIALAMIGGNAIAARLSRVVERRSTILIGAAVAQAVAAIIVGTTGSFAVAAPALIVALGTLGVIGPVKQSYVHQIIPSEHRATVVSFDSMIGSGGGVVGQVGLGRWSDVRGLGSGFVASGLAAALAVPLYVAVRRLAEPADLLEVPPPTPPCAGQGLPEIAGVDTARRTPAEEG